MDQSVYQCCILAKNALMRRISKDHTPLCFSCNHGNRSKTHTLAGAHTHNKAGQMKSKRAQTFIRESHFLPLSCTSQFSGGEEKSGGWEGGFDSEQQCSPSE